MAVLLPFSGGIMEQFIYVVFFHLLIGICSGIFVRLQTIWWWMEGVVRSYGWMVAFVCPTITTDFPSHMIMDWLLNLSSGNQTWQLIHSWLAIKIPPCIYIYRCSIAMLGRRVSHYVFFLGGFNQWGQPDLTSPPESCYPRLRLNQKSMS